MSNEHPFLSHIATYITYEEIYENSLSFDELIRLIRTLPQSFWVISASISILIIEYHELEPKYQALIFNNLFPKELAEKNISIDGAPRVFFNRTQLLVLLRLESKSSSA